MAQTSITLTASMRSNLSSLKSIQKQMDTTQEKLSTGKKVNSAIDNASSYYQARALTNRAADLDSLLDSMGQGIQTIQAANEGIVAITSYVEQLKSVATSAFALDSTSETYKTELQAYQDQYNAILKEIGTLAKDSSYQGVNLLKDSNLTVMFNETRTHSLTIDGDNVTAEMANKGAAGFAWERAADTNDVGNGTINWIGQVVEAEITKTTATYTMQRGDAFVAVTGDVADENCYSDETCETQVTKGTNLTADTTYYRKVTQEKTMTFNEDAAKAEGDIITDGGKDWKVTAAAGVKTETVKTVTKSAAEAIDTALTAISNINTYLRSYATELGNNFSIIETRQNFTDALVDVLETGSDNLVLADMNEESANYLALQTRQQLAINSLSLASQSAQSVLSLF